MGHTVHKYIYKFRNNLRKFPGFSTSGNFLRPLEAQLGLMATTNRHTIMNTTMNANMNLWQHSSWSQSIFQSDVSKVSSSSRAWIGDDVDRGGPTSTPDNVSSHSTFTITESRFKFWNLWGETLLFSCDFFLVIEVIFWNDFWYFTSSLAIFKSTA